MRKTLILVTAFMMMAYPLGAVGAPAEGDEKMLNELRAIDRGTSAEEHERILNKLRETPGVVYAVGAGIGLGAGLALTVSGAFQGSPEMFLTGTGITALGASLCAKAFKRK